MKRCIIAFLALMVLLSLAGCNPYQLTSQPTSQPTTKPETKSTALPTIPTTSQPTISDKTVLDQDLSHYLVEENGSHYLILPISGERIWIYVSESNVVYLHKIDLALLTAAELKLTKQMEPYHVEYHFWVYVNNEQVWLTVEAIRDLDPPEEGEFEYGGCGIDHEHILLEEQISK